MFQFLNITTIWKGKKLQTLGTVLLLLFVYSITHDLLFQGKMKQNIFLMLHDCITYDSNMTLDASDNILGEKQYFLFRKILAPSEKFAYT